MSYPVRCIASVVLMLPTMAAATDRADTLGDPLRAVGPVRSIIFSRGVQTGSPESFEVEWRTFRRDGQILRSYTSGALYSYDGTGRIAEMKSSTERKTYRYAVDGKLAAITIVPSSVDRPRREVVYVYRTDGTLEYRNHFDTAGKLLRRESETYDSSDRLIEIRMDLAATGKAAASWSRQRIEYDERGREQKRTIEFSDVESRTTTMSYASDGTTAVAFYEGDRLWSASQYDSAGNQSVSLVLSWNGPITRGVKDCYSYTFDSFGNWTTKRERQHALRFDHPPQIEEVMVPCGKTSKGPSTWRKIKYYQ